MKKISLLSILLGLCFLSSCGGSQKTNDKGGYVTTSDTTTLQSVNEQDSIILHTYFGVLPCADCMGIETFVKLEENNTYTQQITYLDTDKPVFKEKGKFKWCAKSRLLTLISNKNDTTRFEVGENNITLLGKDGKKPTGELAENYILYILKRK